VNPKRDPYLFDPISFTTMGYQKLDYHPDPAAKKLCPIVTTLHAGHRLIH
jgi:hypothetical protein